MPFFKTDWFPVLTHAMAAWMLVVLAACGGGGGGSSTSVDSTPVAPTVPAAPDSAASAATVNFTVDWPPLVFEVSADKPFLIELSTSGEEGKKLWSVRCGAELDCQIVQDTRLQLTSRASANIVDSRVTLTATNSQGVAASRTVPFLVFPKSLPLKSLLGAPERPGLHLLILSEGFLPEQLDDFHAAASNFMKMFFDDPAIAAHRDAWNVHMVDLLMRDGTGKPVASPLEARFDCGGSTGLICVEDGRALRISSMILPHFTEVLVIVNSTRGLGSGGKVAVIPRDAFSANVAVHELGHTFAGLGDEYSDPYPGFPPFVEGDYPNLTRFTDRDRVPWRHWIRPETPLPTPEALVPETADTPLVGLFQGGAYVTGGVYRPTSVSFMRAIAAPVGPVNGEIWARQVYAKGGAWSEVAPVAGKPLSRTDRPPGGWIFTARPLLDRSIAETRWYVEGVERADQRGAAQLPVATPGPVQVRVDLVDITSRVRLNQGVVSSVTWTVP